MLMNLAPILLRRQATKGQRDRKGPETQTKYVVKTNCNN